MAVSTQAEVVFSGSGNLKDLLDKVNGGIKNFGVNSEKATSHLVKLNKESKITDKLFESLKKNVTGVHTGLLDLGRKGGNSINFIKDAAANTVNFNDSLSNASKGLSGLGLKFLGLKDGVIGLNSVLAIPSAHILEIATASDNTQRAFIILTKISYPLRMALGFLSDTAILVGEQFNKLEKVVVAFIRKGIDVATLSINFFVKTLQGMAESFGKFGLYGKMVASQLTGISKNLETAAVSGERFSDSLKPKDLEKVATVGDKLGTTLFRIGEGLNTAASGIFLADNLGKAFRTLTGFRDKTVETAKTVREVQQVTTEYGGKAITVYGDLNSKLNTVALTAGAVGDIFGNKVSKSIGTLAGKLNGLVVSAATFTTIAVGASDASLKVAGLNDTFSAMQSLGIDTSAAEIAFSFGLVGEKLLLSTEAAREFARVAIQSFARTEDAAGFVTTISSGANLQFEGLSKGIQSVTGFTRQLSNELNNAATSTEVSAALYNSLSAGIGITKDNTVDLTQTTNFLNAALKLSSGTGADAAATVDLLSKVTTVYGLSANDAAVTASKLNQVVESGQITFSQLTGNLGQTASVAQATGVSLDETLSSVAALTKIQGGEALTGFASLMSAITGQGAEAANAVKELGVQFDLNAVKTKGLNVALADLNTAAGGNASTLKKIIPDVLAYQSAQALMGPVAADVQNNMSAMNSEIIKTGESLDSVFAAGQSSAIKQLSALMSGFNEVLVDFGQRTLPAIQPGIDFLQGLLERLQNMNPVLKDFIGFIVLSKIAFGNITEGIISFGMTIASVITGLIAMNLLTKTMSGQLGLEARVVRKLVEEHRDYGGALFRLIGLNKDVIVSGTQLKVSLEKSQEAFEKLKKVGITPKDTGIDGLKQGIEEINKQINNLKAGNLQITDPVEFENSLSELKSYKKEAEEAIRSIALSQRLAVDELPKLINKSIKDGTKSVLDRSNDLQKVINSMFTPDRVGEENSKLFQATVNNLFENSLNESEITVRQKLLDITNTFELLEKNTTPELKRYLIGVERQLADGTSRLGNSIAPLEKALKDSLGILQKTVPDEISDVFIQAVAETKGGITNIESSIKKSKMGLQKVFGDTISALPEEIDKQKPKLKSAVKTLLNDSTKTLNERIEVFNKTFGEVLKDAPDDIKAQAGGIRAATVEVAKAMEVKVEESSLLNNVLRRTVVGASREINKLERLSSTAGAVGSRIGGNLFELTKEAAEKADFKEVFAKNAKEIQEALSTLPGIIKNEFLGVSAAVLVGFDTLMEDKTISEVAKKSIEDAQNTLKKALKDFSTGSISFEKLEEAFENARFDLNNSLSGVASPELISKINTQLDRVDIKSLEERFNNGVIAIQQNLDKIIDPALRAKIEERLRNVNLDELETEAEQVVQQVNTEIKQIANPQTTQVVNNNLAKVQKELLLMNYRSIETGKSGSKAFNGLRNGLDGVSGVLYGINPQLGAILSTTSNLLTSFSEVSEGGQEIFSGVGEAMEKSKKSTNKLGLENRNFVKGMSVTNVVTDVSVAKQKTLMTATTLTAAAKKKLAGSMLAVRGAAQTATPALIGLGTGLKGAALAAWSFVSAAIAMAAPFLVIGGLIAATIAVLGEYIPAIGKIIDADQKFAATSKETNKELQKNLDIFSQYQKDSSKFRGAANENAKSLSVLKAELKEEKVDPSSFIDEKAFVTGWQRAIIYPLEAISMLTIGTFANLDKWTMGGLKNLTRVAQWFTQNIPFVGQFFKKLGDGAQASIDNTEMQSSKVAGNIRGFFNKVRTTVQDARAADTRDAIAMQQLQTNALLGETDKLTQISEKSFGVASERSKKIMALAAEGNRALTSTEMQEVLKEENDLANLGLEVLNEQISSKEKLLESIKDEKAKAALEAELGILRSQTSEIEKQQALRAEFLNNQQAIGTALENSDGAKNTESTVNRVQKMYTDLASVANGAEAQKIFAELNNLEVSTNEAGESIINISEKTLSTASLASRNASIALKANIATFATNAANSTNAAFNISQDDLATNIMNVIEGVNRQLSEDPSFAAEGAAIIENLLTTNVKTINGVGEAFGSLTAAQQRDVLEAQSEVFKSQLAQEVKEQEANIEAINVLRDNGTIDTLDSLKAIAVEQTSIDEAKERDLLRQLELARKSGEQSQIFEDAERALADFRNEMSLNRTKEGREQFEEELSRLQAIQENEIKALENVAATEKNIRQLREKAINQETKALESQKNLTSAINTFEETLLQNKLKLTSDVEEKAKIEVELAEQRLDILESEMEFEKQNLILQQDLNKLSAEREQIELRIQKAEIENQKIVNQQKIDNAELNNLNEREVKALELQNESLELQSKLLGDTQNQLASFAVQQAEMDDRAIEALDLRQRAQTASAEVELELARRNQVIEGLNKQVEIIQLQARLVEVTNQERTVGLQNATALMEEQTKILEEQKTFLENMKSIIEQNYQIAINAERNEFRKRRLEEEAARSKLQSLKTQQQIELAIFKINEQQKDLALEVRQIELAAAREKAAADIAVAEAEAAKVAADPNATREQRAAAELTIRAAEAQLSSVEAQRELAGQERELNARNAGLRDLQFRQQQENAITQQEFAIAQTTRRRSDDREIARESISRARELEVEFQQMADNFLTNITQNPSALQGINTPVNAQQLASQVLANPDLVNKKLEGVVDLNLNINVEGNTDAIDRDEFKKLASTTMEDGLYQLFDSIQVRQRN